MHNGLEEDWARYFYCPKTSKAEKNKGLEDLKPKKNGIKYVWSKRFTRYGRNSIDNDVTGRFVTEKQNVHPTVKPDRS